MYPSDYDLAAVARAIGEPARATMLLRLMDGQAHTASDLAAAAGVSQPTASAHLAHLASLGLIAVTATGRRRLHTVASADVAAAIEALGAIAPLLPVESLRQARTGGQLQVARVCYSHLGGALAVTLAGRLIADGVVAALAHNQISSVISLGHPLLRELGICDLDRGPGPAVRGCLDWTEQVPHLAGRLGTALLTALLEHHWVTRRPRDRALDISPLGEKHLRMLSISIGIPALASCFPGRSRSPGSAPASAPRRATPGPPSPSLRSLSSLSRPSPACSSPCSATPASRR